MTTTLTTDNIQALADLLRPHGRVTITGLESWIHESLRGTPAVRLDMGDTRYGLPIYLYYRVGDDAPMTSDSVTEAVAAIRQKHAARHKEIQANLRAEREVSR